MQMRSLLMEITPQVADLQQSPLISTTNTIPLPGAASPEEGEDSDNLQLWSAFLELV